MGNLMTYRQIVQDVLSHYVDIQYAHSDIENELIFDSANDRYLVMSIGWQKAKRIHGCLIHIDIINEKVWIQRDGTEHGIAYDLMNAGIPQRDIVLAFHPPDVRPHTQFAVA